MSDSFGVAVRRALDESGVPARLARLRGRPAIVLERRARAAGETAWFVCRGVGELEELVGQLRAGSCVSFYFDDRFEIGAHSPADGLAMMRIIDATGDVLVGQLDLSDIHVEMEILADAGELDEYIATLGSATTICFGPFPARDSDGENAITLTLPDLDGVVRSHPH